MSYEKSAAGFQPNKESLRFYILSPVRIIQTTESGFAWLHINPTALKCQMVLVCYSDPTFFSINLVRLRLVRLG
jgi:hypothetical protein